MAERTYTCPKCGTVTEHEYEDGSSYSSMFNDGDWVTVTCRKCNHELDRIKEY